MSIIEDGTGNGKSAKVSSANRLYTDSVSDSTFGNAGVLGRAANGGTGLMNVTTADTGLLMFIKNTSETLSYRVTRINQNWNGGSTTFNKPLTIIYYKDSTAPDTNITQSAFLNTNVSNSFEPPITNLVWDGVGTGMTGHTGLVSAGVTIIGMGTTVSETDGAFILGPGDTSALSVIAVEDGTLFISLQGFFEDLT